MSNSREWSHTAFCELVWVACVCKVYPCGSGWHSSVSLPSSHVMWPCDILFIRSISLFFTSLSSVTNAVRGWQGRAFSVPRGTDLGVELLHGQVIDI